MQYIIYDLEATCWKNQVIKREQEIIEIGAIKINQLGEATEYYDKFIQPVIHPYLSFFCQELTSIRQIDVTRAKTFPDVVEDFQDWINVFNEDYLLCSWGMFDKKIMKKNCELHQLDSHWVQKHINLKQQYAAVRKLKHAIGLKKAVEKEGFEFEGIHHRAISDAKNLAKLFLKFFGEWHH